MVDSHENDHGKSVIDKLAKLIDSGEISLFDKSEVATIRRMIQTYQAFEGFGRLADVARGIVIWVGIMVGAYLSFSGWLYKFIRAAAGN